MITNYKQFNEGVLDHLIGPTEEDVLNNMKDVSANDILNKSVVDNFILGVKYALKKGCFYNQTFRTALKLAIETNKLEIAEMILNDANIRFTIEVINDSLTFIVKKPVYYDMVKLLLEYIPSIEDKDELIKSAEAKGNVEIAKLLKKYKNV